jgi:hypothetical protein
VNSPSNRDQLNEFKNRQKTGPDCLKPVNISFYQSFNRSKTLNWSFICKKSFISIINYIYNTPLLTSEAARDRGNHDKPTQLVIVIMGADRGDTRKIMYFYLINSLSKSS